MRTRCRLRRPRSRRGAGSAPGPGAHRHGGAPCYHSVRTPRAWGCCGTINHLGVETETADEVVAAEARLADTGLDTTGVDDTQCCYATKTETWVAGPDDTRWEWYVKTGDIDQLQNIVLSSSGGGCSCST
jgi:hypothetical protein